MGDEFMTDVLLQSHYVLIINNYHDVTSLIFQTQSEVFITTVVFFFFFLRLTIVDQKYLVCIIF
jgi:hypothetical protein